MDELDAKLLREIKNYFSDRVSDFCSGPGNGIPPAVHIEFSLYKCFLAGIEVERNTAFFGVRESKLFISLLSTELLDSNSHSDKCCLKKSALEDLDREIRLRIPDKYLKAKGWI
jgi:hypothetical protein